MTAEQILYLVGALGVLVLLFGLLRMVRGRRSTADAGEGWEAEEQFVSEDEDAADRSADNALPVPKRGNGPSSDSDEQLEIVLEPRKLSIGLVNATLSYRLMLTNRREAPMVALRITSDILSAHASRPTEEYLRGPDIYRAMVQKVPRLDPEESASLPGELVLPLGEVQPLAQGESYAMLPLVRLRVVGAGTPPVIRTALVGRPPEEEGGRLKLFPLDAGPKVYTDIAARVLE